MTFVNILPCCLGLGVYGLGLEPCCLGLGLRVSETALFTTLFDTLVNFINDYSTQLLKMVIQF